MEGLSKLAQHSTPAHSSQMALKPALFTERNLRASAQERTSILQIPRAALPFTACCWLLCRVDLQAGTQTAPNMPQTLPACTSCRLSVILVLTVRLKVQLQWTFIRCVAISDMVVVNCSCQLLLSLAQVCCIALMSKKRLACFQRHIRELAGRSPLLPVRISPKQLRHSQSALAWRLSLCHWDTC
jgi:hypothetical protein